MHMSGPRLVAALLSVAAAAAVTLVGTTGAQAEPQAPAHGKLIGSFTPQELTSQPTSPPHLASPLKASPKKCWSLPAGSAARKAGATTACMKITPGSSSAPTARSRAAQASAAACTETVPGDYTYNRLAYCLTGDDITYDEYDSLGLEIGTGVLTVNSSAALSARSGQWQESETVTLTSVSGLVDELDVGLTASCDASCTAISPTPWAGTTPLTLGQSASGTVTFQSVPGAGNVSNITTSYTLTGLQPGTIPIIPSVSWSNPRPVRCDTTFPFAQNTSTGCVIPAVQPQLVLSLATYGAAAALYGFAEQLWIDEWGTSGNPLQREANPAIQDAHRTSTCGTGASRPFVTNPSVVPDDSCDEYPFAATTQGGTNGGLCADVFPLLENGTWELFEDTSAPDITFEEPCLRGHVPSAQNSLVGTALSNFAQNQRVIDLEKYIVVVTD